MEAIFKMVILTLQMPYFFSVLVYTVMGGGGYKLSMILPPMDCTCCYLIWEITALSECKQPGHSNDKGCVYKTCCVDGYIKRGGVAHHSQSVLKNDLHWFLACAVLVCKLCTLAVTRPISSVTKETQGEATKSTTCSAITAEVLVYERHWEETPFKSWGKEWVSNLAGSLETEPLFCEDVDNHLCHSSLLLH